MAGGGGEETAENRRRWERGPRTVAVKAELVERGGGEAALVEKVVNAEDGARPEVHPVGAVLGRQEDRHQRRVPVVRDKHAVVAVREAAQRDLRIVACRDQRRNPPSEVLPLEVRWPQGGRCAP